MNTDISILKIVWHYWSFLLVESHNHKFLYYDCQIRVAPYTLLNTDFQRMGFYQEKKHVKYHSYTSNEYIWSLIKEMLQLVGNHIKSLHGNAKT